MIKEQTTFILGAGSNVEYGFPTGHALKKRICDLLEVGSLMYKILIECGFDSEKLKHFRNAFWGSPISTIDEYISLNPNFDKLAKYAICVALIPQEEKSVFDGKNPSLSWYHKLFNFMLDGNNWENFSKNNVSFITFNYDRSLEYFFFKSLKNTYTELKLDDLHRVMQSLNIIHVHGKIGNLSWEGETDLREYNSNVDRVNLIKASSSIITINESNESTKEYVQARKLIGNSKRVVFLGFGFHNTNIRRLNANTCLNEKEILGTAKGISQRRMKEILEFIPNSKVATLSDYTCSNFMNQKIHQLL